MTINENELNENEIDYKNTGVEGVLDLTTSQWKLLQLSIWDHLWIYAIDNDTFPYADYEEYLGLQERGLVTVNDFIEGLEVTYTADATDFGRTCFDKFVAYMELE